VKAATANGGNVVEAPYDIPGVGRTARIADPQGAELCPFKSNEDEPTDALPPRGGLVLERAAHQRSEESNRVL
jgi:hypothetical protein